MIAKLSPIADVLKEWTPTPSGILNFYQALLDDPQMSDGATTNLRTNGDDKRISFQMAPVPADFVSFNAFVVGMAYHGQTGADPSDTCLIFVKLTINGVEKSEVQAPAFASPTDYQYREVTAPDWKLRKGDVVIAQFRSNLIPFNLPSPNLRVFLSAFRGVLDYEVSPWTPIPQPVTNWSQL